MTTVNAETVTPVVADAVIAKAKPSKKVAKKVDATPVAKATVDWATIDNKALTSQGHAIAVMARAMKALGRTHEQAKSGEWVPTKAFQSFRTDYLMQVGKVLGDEEAKARGGVIIRFALRSLRVNLTPDVLEKTTGKVQTVLEEKEEAFAKSGRVKTDHSLGGTPGKGGRPGGKVTSAVDLALAYLNKLDGDTAEKAIVQYIKTNKKVQRFIDLLK